MGKSTPENVVVVVCPVTRFRNKPVPYRWRSQRQGGSNKHGNSPTRLQKSATANERESFLPRLLPTTTCSRAAGEARRRRILVFVWKMQRVYCELFFFTNTPINSHEPVWWSRFCDERRRLADLCGFHEAPGAAQELNFIATTSKLNPD